jgi:Xaa-Pro aminopeptidase
MRPALRRGRSVWDRDLLPPDEFGVRLRATEAALEAADLEAVVIVGGPDQGGHMTYLANFLPGHRWATLIVRPAHGPVLLAGLGGGRDLPHVRSLSCVSDVRFAPSLGKGIAGILAEQGLPRGRVGTAGLTTCWPVGLYREALRDLAAYDLVEIDSELARLRRVKRPRELRLLGRVGRILERARQAALAALARGASNAGALVEAERCARWLGAGDVRCLANLAAANELRPYTGPDRRRNLPLVCHLAAEVDGYWADLGFTHPAAGSPLVEDARRSLAAMRRAARPGATAGQVAEAGCVGLDERGRAAALSLGLGEGIGLGRLEPPVLRPGSGVALMAGEVLGLRAWRLDDRGCALETETVIVEAGGGRRLDPA